MSGSEGDQGTEIEIMMVVFWSSPCSEIDENLR